MKKASDQMGTCQICGAGQKLPSGKLSLHGYNVQWGFFNGICAGSRQLPYEVSCEYCKEVIKGNGRVIDSLNDRIRKVKASLPENKGILIPVQKYGVSHTMSGSFVSDGKFVLFEYEEGGVKKTYRMYTINYTAQTIEDALKEYQTKQVNVLLNQIRMYEKHIKYLEEKVRDWTPQETQPVTVVADRNKADAEARRVARENMFYYYTTPDGNTLKRKKTPGKESAFVLVGVLDKTHYDYRRNAGFLFVRAYEDLAKATKGKQSAIDKDTKYIADAYPLNPDGTYGHLNLSKEEMESRLFRTFSKEYIIIKIN